MAVSRRISLHHTGVRREHVPYRASHELKTTPQFSAVVDQMLALGGLELFIKHMESIPIATIKPPTDLTGVTLWNMFFETPGMLKELGWFAGVVLFLVHENLDQRGIERELSGRMKAVFPPYMRFFVMYFIPGL
jgi:hypothetical protein